jgi:hypothetical protein
MCFLKVFSEIDSFKKFKEETNLPVYSCYDKGEKSKKRTFKDYWISFDVSNKEWDNFNGQVEDAILFLKKYKNEIGELLNRYSILDAYLDFPIYSRLDDNIVNQNDHLPRELVTLAGELHIGIEMAIYSRNAFDECT